MELMSSFKIGDKVRHVANLKEVATILKLDDDGRYAYLDSFGGYTQCLQKNLILEEVYTSSLYKALHE